MSRAAASGAQRDLPEHGARFEPFVRTPGVGERDLFIDDRPQVTSGRLSEELGRCRPDRVGVDGVETQGEEGWRVVVRGQDAASGW